MIAYALGGLVVFNDLIVLFITYFLFAYFGWFGYLYVICLLMFNSVVCYYYICFGYPRLCWVYGYLVCCSFICTRCVWFVF